MYKLQLMLTVSFIMTGLVTRAMGNAIGNPSEPQCLDTEFKCTDGQCIADGLVCDGEPSCKDSSDEDKQMCIEKPCPNDLPHKCEVSGLCISRDWMCNGHSDCPKGSDETTDACINKLKMRQRNDYELQYGLFGDEATVHLI